MKLIVVRENYYPRPARTFFNATDYVLWKWYAKMHPNDFIVVMSD